MKRFVLLTIAVITGLTLRAQMTAPTVNYGAYEKKVQKSDADIQDPKKSENPKTWISRGSLFQEIYELNNIKFLQKGADEKQIQLIFFNPQKKETLQFPNGIVQEKLIYDGITLIFENGKLVDWDETKTVTDKPLDKAFDAYAKAQELDKENKFTKALKKNLEELKNQYLRDGSYMYDKGMRAEEAGESEKAKEYFQNSYHDFAAMLKINEIPAMGNVKDTSIMYYTGVAARKAGRPDNAIVYFEQARALNYNEPLLYELLANSYAETGQDDKAIEVLKEGFQRFRDNNRIVIALINNYLKKGDSQAALDYLAIAKQQDPNNKTFYFAEGTLYDKLGKVEEAKAAYQKALEIDPNYYDAIFNFGVLYYTQAKKLIDEAAFEKDPTESARKEEIALKELAKCVPYLEKALELQPNDRNILETLQPIYYKLKMMDKYEKVKEQLKNM